MRTHTHTRSLSRSAYARTPTSLLVRGEHLQHRDWPAGAEVDELEGAGAEAEDPVERRNVAEREVDNVQIVALGGAVRRLVVAAVHGQARQAARGDALDEGHLRRQ